MTVLPILGRELRQQARRASTVWVRASAAFVAGVAAITILGSLTPGSLTTPNPGRIVFSTLSTVLLVLCLFEGVRQTSDCLSREKREGTLGLLMITRLRGFDVVLGKLAATSIGSCYALMAVFPALAIALLYGGVTAGEFWRVQVVLLDALFLGLTIGMWTSAAHRLATRSLMAGLTWVAALTMAPMTVEFLLRRGPVPNVSPGVALRLAGDLTYAASPERFWLSVVAIFGLAWVFLFAAGRCVSRVWQEEERPATLDALLIPPPDEGQRPWAPEGEPVWTEDLSAYQRATPESERPDRSLIDVSVSDWLAVWVPQHRFLIGLSVLLLALGMFSGGMLGFRVFGGGASAVLWITTLLPWLFLAYVSSRPMSEARRNGAFELLLPTPLSTQEIIEAHWKGLWRQIHGPFRTACAMVAVIFIFWAAAALTSGRLEANLLLAVQLLTCVGRVMTGLAVCRMGLYWGLRAKTLPAAIGQNLFWVVAVPFIFNAVAVLVLSRSLLFFRPSPNVFMNYWMLNGVQAIVGILYSLFLIHWATTTLVVQFRELASHSR